jgi:hypothetical protein
MVINKLIRRVILAVVLLYGLGPLPASAALQAYVDRNPVAEDESFTLTLQSDEDLDGSPDLSPLRRDFDIQQDPMADQPHPETQRSSENTVDHHR